MNNKPRKQEFLATKNPEEYQKAILKNDEVLMGEEHIEENPMNSRNTLEVLRQIEDVVNENNSSFTEIIEDMLEEGFISAKDLCDILANYYTPEEVIKSALKNRRN